jgi:hypothetical protein
MKSFAKTNFYMENIIIVLTMSWDFDLFTKQQHLGLHSVKFQYSVQKFCEMQALTKKFYIILQNFVKYHYAEFA